MNFIFQSSLKFMAKLKGRCRDIPYASCPHTHVSFPIINIPYQSGAFVTIHKPTEGDGTHSSTLAWQTPWTEEPGGLQSMGSLGVGHYWATSLSLFTSMHWRRKWQPTPVFLPGKSQGQGSLVGCQSRTRLKWLSSTTLPHLNHKIPWLTLNFTFGVLYSMGLHKCIMT